MDPRKHRRNMTRIDIPYNGETRYTLESRVRMGDINHAEHLGFDRLVSIVYDTALSFLRAEETDRTSDGSAGVIFADLAVRYLSEAFHGDVLSTELAIGEMNGKGFDLQFRVTNRRTSRPVALAKIGVRYFDYRRRKATPIPDDVRRKLVPAEEP
jgi:acyl-CoA thioesterase FadM